MLKKIILFLNYSSIDVCIGVLSLMLPLANLLAENPNVSWYIVVPLSVLLVYFVDHFLDLKLNPNKIISHRHQFIQTNLKTMVLVSIVIVILNTILSLLYFDYKIFIYGIALSLIIGLYYFINSISAKIIYKEFFAALIYSIGIILYPICIQLEMAILQYGLLVFSIAFINLIQNSLNEINDDLKIETSSIAILGGEKISFSILYLLYVILSIQLFYYDLNIQIKIAFLLLMLTHAIFFFVRRNKNYRLITEFSFWIPGIIFLFFN